MLRKIIQTIKKAFGASPTPANEHPAHKKSAVRKQPVNWDAPPRRKTRNPSRAGTPSPRPRPSAQRGDTPPPAREGRPDTGAPSRRRRDVSPSKRHDDLGAPSSSAAPAPRDDNPSAWHDEPSAERDDRDDETTHRSPSAHHRSPSTAHRPLHRKPPASSSHAQWDASTFTVPLVEGKKRFHEFDLPSEIMHAIHDLGFEYCTPIQAETLELTMAGRNVAGRAQTGTGKTAAFLITILKRMKDVPDSRPSEPGRPAALVLAPTRELVIQIGKDAEAIGKYLDLRCVAVYGGMDYDKQERALAAGPVDLVVATPGRLLDFRRSHAITLQGVHTLVIDEADRMLDMGFIPDVRRIIRDIPDQRQTLLFSATLTEVVLRLAGQFMPDPVRIEVDAEHRAVDTITQLLFPIASREKFIVLYNFLKLKNPNRVLIFCNRKSTCERLHERMAEYGIEAEVLSGDIEQKKRLRTLEDFRHGKLKIVVATDVAGRGIHVDDIDYVVNFDFPYEADDYIHRIGRTGRAGHQGTAISFACEDESFIIPDIEKLLEMSLPCQQPEEAYFAELPPPATPRRAKRERRDTDGRRGYGGERRGPGRHSSRHAPRER